MCEHYHDDVHITIGMLDMQYHIAAVGLIEASLGHSGMRILRNIFEPSGYLTYKAPLHGS